jgi:hypothetical protein
MDGRFSVRLPAHLLWCIRARQQAGTWIVAPAPCGATVALAAFRPRGQAIQIQSEK